MNLKRTISALLLIAVMLSAISANSIRAHAADWCVSGYRYGGAGTPSNYVEFRVNFSANSWYVKKPWWALPIDLWANPDSQGVAKAGIWGTDYNPPYSPSNYQLCGRY